MILDSQGYLGLGTNVAAFDPTHPIHHTNGARLTLGGAWENGSSRELKEDIQPLDEVAALAAVEALEPVRFRYLAEPDEEYVGFIAEDVPDLVASSGRNGLSSMDMVALLTKVVQVQQKTIADLGARLTKLEATISPSLDASPRARAE